MFILRIKQYRMYLKDTGECYREHHRGRRQQAGLGSSPTEPVSDVGPCYPRHEVAQVIFYVNQIFLVWLTATHFCRIIFPTPWGSGCPPVTPLYTVWVSDPHPGCSLYLLTPLQLGFQIQPQFFPPSVPA